MPWRDLGPMFAFDPTLRKRMRWLVLKWTRQRR
jgi:hypothetical protein